MYWAGVGTSRKLFETEGLPLCSFCNESLLWWFLNISVVYNIPPKHPYSNPNRTLFKEPFRGNPCRILMILAILEFGESPFLESLSGSGYPYRGRGGGGGGVWGFNPLPLTF